MDIKYIIIISIILIIFFWIIFKYEILWFLKALDITRKNKKGIKDIQKLGINIRNLSNKQLKEYIKISKKYLKNLNLEKNKKFKINKELERHLRYSKFSEKYVEELFNEILNHMKLKNKKVKLKINYISSKYYIPYAGLYSDQSETKEITINIKNNMTLNTIISILAHECTHYLLLSNNIKLEEQIQNECLTDVTTILLGFEKYMLEGYKIFNNVIYDEENKRLIDKNRVGYLTYKDIKYVARNMKIVR